MWTKRQRYVFRKRSIQDRVLWPIVGILVIVGLFWFLPWQSLSPEAVEDTPESVASKDQSEQASAEDKPEQADNEESKRDRPEQETSSDRPKDESAPEETPPEEEGASNDLSPPSLPPAAQLFPPPQAPSPPATLGVEEVPRTSLSPNDYWYPGPDYWY